MIMIMMTMITIIIIVIILMTVMMAWTVLEVVLRAVDGVMAEVVVSQLA